jgi:superfamily II DNA or RNA helicase
VALASGDRITVRGERWVVQEATAFADVTLLSLAGAEGDARDRHCRLLAPFDRPVLISRTPVIRAVTRRQWMHHLHSQIAGMHTFGQLRAPQAAEMDILPFQLEPALAMVRGHASRFLLADEVGLGKTIQAGLMLAELRVRGWCEHALIVVPAGLRQQWADELHRRFQLQAVVMDAASLASLTDSLPFDVNPWAVEPVTITSIDFLKQPEVLRGVASLVWDALIVDEAHHATIASLRYDAVNALAQRARHVVLLTATPHGGDDRAYRALCAIGAGEDDGKIVLFRRTREMAGMARARRAHLLPVRATRETTDMHRLLADYVARLWDVARQPGRRDVQLAAMVLAKRAFSSAHSLVISLERRLAGLKGEIDVPSQSALPFGIEDDLSDEAPMPLAPAFARAGEERALVQRIIHSARSAFGHEGKMHALTRIVRRVREPLIIFTEYRDTLDAIRNAIGGLREVVMLHGGQTAQERRQALQIFTSGTADVLLATDAGSEGLNLQGCCRVVINLELPWSPIRLEQRIGRVDRIGQRRTVHAINLLAAGTAERTVLASLLHRIDRIRLSEIDIAASVISQSKPATHPAPVETCAAVIDVSAAAHAETARIAQARRVLVRSGRRPEHVVPVVVHRSSPPSLTALFRIRLVTRASRLVEDTFVPVRIAITSPRHRLKPREIRAFAESLLATVGSELVRHAQAHAERRAGAIERESDHVIRRNIRRERAVSNHIASSPAVLVQAGLFESRALRQKWAADERGDALRRESQARANLLEASSQVVVANEPELAMVVIQCSQA